MNKAQVRKMSMTGLACFLSDCAFVWWIIGPRVSQHIELYERLSALGRSRKMKG
jgi:hypothetical protein